MSCLDLWNIWMTYPHAMFLYLWCKLPIQTVVEQITQTDKQIGILIQCIYLLEIEIKCLFVQYTFIHLCILKHDSNINLHQNSRRREVVTCRRTWVESALWNNYCYCLPLWGCKGQFSVDLLVTHFSVCIWITPREVFNFQGCFATDIVSCVYGSVSKCKFIRLIRQTHSFNLELYLFEKLLNT